MKGFFMEKKTYSLFSGRHDLPANEGSIFESFDFKNFTGQKTNLYDELLSNGGKLLVTGLTPALTQFLSDWVKYSSEREDTELILLHYNTETKSYVEQKF